MTFSSSVIEEVTSTVSAGTTTTTPAGTPCNVTNLGTPKNRILNFSISQGIQGLKGDKGDQGNTGPAGQDGLSSSVFVYTFNTQTTGTPANGNLFLNNSDVSLATVLNVSHIDKNPAHDIDQLLNTVNIGSKVIIQHSTDSNIYINYYITSRTVNTGYVSYGVNYDSKLGTIVNGREVIIIIQMAGIAGPAGPAGTNATNPNFTASVTSSGSGVTPAVSLSGTYPNLALGFALKNGTDGSNGTNGTNGTNATNPNFSASVTSSGSGVTPAVSLTGTYPNLALGFALKNGTDGINGNNGTSATIAVGTVTTGSAGSSASVINVGTSSSAIFNFSIPKGDTGSSGTSTFCFEPNNMSDGGQLSIGAGSFYKCFFSPATYTCTQLRYAKLNATASSIYFAIYNSSGSLLATASHISSTTQGYNTITWNTPINFTTGQQYYFSHSSSSSLSTLVYGVGVGGATNVPSLFYWQSSAWASNVAPSTITISTSNSIISGTGIIWHMLF
jgi:hypothetical protein